MVSNATMPGGSEAAQTAILRENPDEAGSDMGAGRLRHAGGPSWRRFPLLPALV